MTTLLASNTATSATATEGDVKTFLDNLRTYMADLLGTDSTNKASVQTLLGFALHGKVSKTGAYTVVSSDRGKVIDCTGTWTLNIAPAATLGDGFVFAVRNSGTGAITIDPNLTETINGITTLVIGSGGFYLIYCDGSVFSVVGSAAGSGTQVFTSSGTFTIPPGVTTVKVTVVGGGGGGGGGNSQYGGHGGGAGGASISYFSGITPGNTIAVTVGTGGSGSTSKGSAGGQSSVASGTQLISAVSASGGGGGDVTGGNPGSGGVGTGGSMNVNGGSGGVGSVSITDNGACSGSGGDSIFGGGGRGLGYSSNSAGNAGGAYGGGGSGGKGGSTNMAGGNGASGVVVFEW